MSILGQPHFHDEGAAFRFFEEARWPAGPYCPRCGGAEVDETLIGNDRAIKPKHGKKGRVAHREHRITTLAERVRMLSWPVSRASALRVATRLRWPSDRTGIGGSRNG